MNSKEFIKALDNIILEKGISKDVVYDAMELALATAYKKNFGSKTNVKVKIDRNTGDIRVLSYYVVVDDYDDGVDSVDEEGNAIHIPPEINPDAQILLEEAREIDPTIEIGETIEKEVTPKDFGRVAASTAKQVLTQKIREAERENIMAEFHDKQGEMMMGLLAMEDQKNYYVDLGKSRGIMAKSEIIPGETLKMGTNVRVYITKVEETPKGPLILCSRKHYGFVKRLFETEIPELVDGTIELYSVIREPGVRSKVAVYSNDEKVDPVGACIGERGSRIASILKELNGEKIDVILYDKDPVKFITNALSPAKDIKVTIKDENKKEALAVVGDNNLSLAIGKRGQNVKLASRLTHYKIEVKSQSAVDEENAEEVEASEK